MAISGGIPDTDDDPVAIGNMADVKEVDITYTSRIEMWEKLKYVGEGTYILACRSDQMKQVCRNKGGELGSKVGFWSPAKFFGTSDNQTLKILRGSRYT